MVIFKMHPNTLLKEDLIQFLDAKAKVSTRSYPTGVKWFQKELARVNLKPAAFQGK